MLGLIMLWPVVTWCVACSPYIYLATPHRSTDFSAAPLNWWRPYRYSVWRGIAAFCVWNGNNQQTPEITMNRQQLPETLENASNSTQSLELQKGSYLHQRGSLCSAYARSHVLIVFVKTELTFFN